MASTVLIALTEIDITVEPGQNANPAQGVPAKGPNVKRVPTGYLFKATSAEQQKELVDLLKCAREATQEEQDARPESQPIMDLSTPEKAAVAEALVGQDETAAPNPTVTADAELAQLQQRYAELFGEAPNARLKAAGLRTKIAEKEAEGGLATGTAALGGTHAIPGVDGTNASTVGGESGSDAIL